MNISSLNAHLPAAAETTPKAGASSTAQDAKKIEDSAKQFEAMMIRQVLSDTFKPSPTAAKGQNMPGSDIYQSFMTDTVADSISKGGSLGISNLFQSKLLPGDASHHHHPQARRMNFPTEETHPLIDALRDELQEYGGLLHLLKDQQTALVRRQPEQVMELSTGIEAHLPVVTRARHQRQEELRVLAGKREIADEKAPIRLADLLPYFQPSVSPMIRGLVEEINRLVSQVSRFAHQNQMLLVRAVESTQAALQTVQPSVVHKTYSPAGKGADESDGPIYG